MKTGIEIIAEERARQISPEGYTSDHDDGHQSGELGNAASCYLTAAYYQAHGAAPLPMPPAAWPWAFRFWKPSADHIRNLAKAGALIAAEIDRLQRHAGEGK